MSSEAWMAVLFAAFWVGWAALATKFNAPVRRLWPCDWRREFAARLILSLPGLVAATLLVLSDNPGAAALVVLGWQFACALSFRHLAKLPIVSGWLASQAGPPKTVLKGSF